MSRPEATPAPDRKTESTRRRRSLSIIGVFGEVLLTAGVLVLLFIGWQNFFNTWLLEGRQSGAAAELGKQWLQQSGGASDSTTSSPVPVPTSGAVGKDANIPVEGKPAATADPVGVMYIPRFGTDWKRTIREGTGSNVLDSYDAGIGHYDTTQMPGAVGNFAVAAHDTGYGNTFLHIQNLRLGDKVYVQTKDGFYTYAFRNYEYVPSTAVQVLAKVPAQPDVQASDRIITLTTCNPPYHAVERLIAYGVLESFSKTPPKAIAGEVG